MLEHRLSLLAAKTPRSVSRLLPVRLKDAIRARLRDRILRRSLRQLTSMPPGAQPDRALLEAIRAGWGNLDYSADTAFLAEMLRLLSAGRGPVLECGSGLSTILMGMVAATRGFDTWSLEHDPYWFGRVGQALRKQRIGAVNLVLARLRRYDGYCWYDAPFDGMPRDFQLVICDGPPESTPGGRYGTLSLLRPHLAPGAVLLLDDADTPSGRSVLRRWRGDFGVRFDMLRAPRSSFAVVTM
jgi:hypothetical protein